MRKINLCLEENWAFDADGHHVKPCADYQECSMANGFMECNSVIPVTEESGDYEPTTTEQVFTTTTTEFIPTNPPQAPDGRICWPPRCSLDDDINVRGSNKNCLNHPCLKKDVHGFAGGCQHGCHAYCDENCECHHQCRCNEGYELTCDWKHCQRI